MSAQDAPPSFWAKVRYGGGLGLSVGNGFFGGTLAPGAVYEFNEQLAMGLGTSFTYNSQRNFYNSTIVGGSLIGLYNVIPEIQLSAEFEMLNVSRSFEAGLGLENDLYWYPALFTGAGFRTGTFTVGIRYDVLYDEEKSIYISPWLPFVRFYF
ncbi:MAG: alpha-ketoglutarate decarboxylase [Altibacter sp.]|nr:alpha-ketoglutarate decarboxylase [Altibacter sp.]